MTNLLAFRRLVVRSAGVVGAALLVALAGVTDARSAPQNAATIGHAPAVDDRGRDARVPHVVQCPEQRLADLLWRARRGDTIRIVGTCTERVTITTDDLVLTGSAGAALNGGGGPPAEFDAVLTVDGARRVVIRNLTVQNGPGEGVLVRRGGTATLENVVAEGNGFTGLAIADRSMAALRDVTLRGNAIGLDVFTSSAAVIQGRISATGNGSGVEINGQSIVEIRGGELAATDNFGPGIVAANSQLAIFGFTESQVPGSRIVATGNGAFGIGLPDSSLEIVGGRFEGSGANVVTASDNRGPGIWMPSGGSIANPFGTARILVERNPVGMDLGAGAAVTAIGGLAIHGNNTGVRSDGADTTFVSIPPNPSAITGNGTDVVLSFGARATFGGAQVGSLTCDGTVLARGSAACP